MALTWRVPYSLQLQLLQSLDNPTPGLRSLMVGACSALSNWASFVGSFAPRATLG